MRSSVPQVTFLSAVRLSHSIFKPPIQTGAFWRWNSNSAVNGKSTAMKVFSKEQTLPLAHPAEHSCLDFQFHLPIQRTWQEPTSRQLTQAFKYRGFLETCSPPQDTAAGFLPQTEYFWRGSFLDSIQCYTEGPRGLYKAFVVCFSLFTGTSQLFFPLISYKSEVPAAMVLWPPLPSAVVRGLKTAVPYSPVVLEESLAGCLWSVSPWFASLFYFSLPGRTFTYF